MRRLISDLCFVAALLLGIVCAAQAQFNSFPPGAFTGRAALDPSSGGGSFSLTAQGSSGSATTGAAIINYGTVSYGSGCNAIVIGVWWYPTTFTDTVSGVSVGGSAAAQVAGIFQGAAQSIDMWQLNSPAGTSANITVTYSANVTFNSNVTVYCLTSAHTTVSATNSAAGACTVNLSAAVTVPASGAAIAITGDVNGHTLSFTNATQDSTYVGGGVSYVWGHITATGSVTVTTTPTATDPCNLGLAAYGP